MSDKFISPEEQKRKREEERIKKNEKVKREYRLKPKGEPRKEPVITAPSEPKVIPFKRKDDKDD